MIQTQSGVRECVASCEYCMHVDECICMGCMSQSGAGDVGGGPLMTHFLSSPR